jgi:hypothetical protein
MPIDIYRDTYSRLDSDSSYAMPWSMPRWSYATLICPKIEIPEKEGRTKKDSERSTSNCSLGSRRSISHSDESEGVPIGVRKRDIRL